VVDWKRWVRASRRRTIRWKSKRRRGRRRRRRRSNIHAPSPDTPFVALAPKYGA
ncbi:hypothetical protein BGW39_003065, partial [Mortierella sp. 14UC]